MPFVPISQDVSLHYITNTRNDDVAAFDDAKPVVLLLPPMYHSIDWLRQQLQDPRLSRHYNLIAIDSRNKGRTVAPLCARRDCWVDAADLAVAHEQLQLPPWHVFAANMNSAGAALRFAAVFPGKCLSLCVSTVPVQAGESPEWVVRGFEEVTYAWCFPQDMDEFWRANMEISWFHFNEQIAPELEDECIAYWHEILPPTQRSTFLAITLVGLHRSFLTDKELAAIALPTLFLQGDKSQINPPEKAQEVCAKLPDCKLFVVKGGPDAMTLIPQYASVVNRVFFQFLQAQPPPPRPPARRTRAPPDTEGVCRAGLARLAQLADDTRIAARDARSTLSFCRYTREVVQANAAMFAEFAKGEAAALHPLDAQGRALRRFSERHVEEWGAAALVGRAGAGAESVSVRVE